MEDWPTSREHIEVTSTREWGEGTDYCVTIARSLLADTSVVNSVVPEGVRGGEASDRYGFSAAEGNPGSSFEGKVPEGVGSAE